MTTRKMFQGMMLVLSALLATSCASLAVDTHGIAPQPAAPKIPANVVNFADFGTGDGKTLNTDAFENAFAKLAEKGGGKLIVPPGIWLTGPVHFRSHTELHLERGALIQFSRDYNLYPLTVIDMKGEKEVDSISPLSGQDLEDVAITGAGIIDGGGDAWRPLKKDKLGDGDWKALVKSGGVTDDKGATWYPSRAVMNGAKIVSDLRKANSLNLADYEPAHQFLRPKMLRFIGCHRVLLQDATFQNPPNWTLNPALCDDVSILNVQVRNSPNAQNSDALDLESCRHAIIRNCTFDVGDDGICIKSGKDAPGRRIGAPTEDVLVEGCTVYHAHGGFTIGSEMSGGVRNMRVDNCTFIGTDIGLRFKSMRGRGGVVEKIYVSNVRMMDIPSDAINFDMYYGGRSPLDATAGDTDTNPPPVTEETPQFRDIHIENITCRGARKAIVLEGLPEMAIRDITLKNVSITSQQGVFVTDAENISFENVHVENKTGEALKTLHVKNSKLDLVK
ncbi:MAG TPA: glycoside hydrolase family 28 protein [Verrucomicrobiae bacterium]|nr:glycoside hydrolase family 28 protein [Verrucomicrobiae bacterium]